MRGSVQYSYMERSSTDDLHGLCHSPGGNRISQEFADFDLKMKNSAQVNNPTDLMTEESVKTLVNRKLGVVDQAKMLRCKKLELHRCCSEGSCN